MKRHDYNGYNLIRSEQAFSFHLNGDGAVDALLLSEIIQDFANLTKLVAEAEENNIFIRFNVTALENGSFIINFQAVTEIIENLVNNYNKYAAFAGVVVGGVIGIFKIKKFLKGEAPASQTIQDNSVKIEKNDGTVIVVPKVSASVFTDEFVDRYASNISDNTMKANNGKGFSLSYNNGKIKEYENFGEEDIPFMCTPINKERIIRISTQTVETYFKIRKPAFVGTAQWQLLWNGITIEAKIEDDEWLTAVQEGRVAITANSIIFAQLKIDNELDEDNNPVNTSPKYSIVKVIKFDEGRPPAQIEL